MSRSKPYDRNRDAARDRNPDAPWTHDLHESRSLSSRLAGSPSGSGGSSPSLLNRLSGGKGKELLPDTSRSKLYGFDTAPPANTANRNAGVELLPSGSSAASTSKSARPTRASRNRGLGPIDPGQRALVANGLAALTARSRASTSGNSGSSPNARSLNIVGAARSSIWVRVERLARGTTAEDVKSAFSHAPIGEARLASRSSDRTVTVELELPDRDSADRLVEQYDGVAADGELLRVTVLAGRDAGRGRSDLSARMDKPRRQAEQVPASAPPRSGKMYSDLMEEDAPVITTRQEQRGSSLASRMGRR